MSELETLLSEALRDVLTCLDEHLAQAAHDSNVTVEVLCPCSANEAENARALLAGIDSE
jgi:coproporphyrinogen III oxidase-like Fe-S oxidoreductase